MKRHYSGLMNKQKVFHDKWDANDVKARITMLSTIDLDTLCEFEGKTRLNDCGMLCRKDLVFI